MGKKKQVLITGGTGFIGSNLSRSLIKEGHHVHCVDNLITGRQKAVADLERNPAFRFFQLDITRPDFTETLGQYRYDEIYHLACPTGVPNIRPMAEEMLMTCSVGTMNALDLARRCGARLVYTSSAEVYGDPEVFPQQETYNGNVDPIGPRSAYEEGKRFAEALVAMHAEKYQVEAKIIRLFNVFGNGMSPDDTRVIPQFLKKIRQGQKIIIYGDGNQTRAHLHVSDLIRGLRLVIEKGLPGQAYNIGSSRQVSIRQLAERIDSLTPLPVEIEYRPHFIEDHQGRLPDTRKIRDLGWQARVSLIEGLLAMMPNYGVPVNKSRWEEDPRAIPAFS